MIEVTDSIVYDAMAFIVYPEVWKKTWPCLWTLSSFNVFHKVLYKYTHKSLNKMMNNYALRTILLKFIISVFVLLGIPSLLGGKPRSLGDSLILLLSRSRSDRFCSSYWRLIIRWSFSWRSRSCSESVLRWAIGGGSTETGVDIFSSNLDSNLLWRRE